VLSYAMVQLDILLHPIAPFLTEHLYLTCFRNKDSILLDRWPEQDDKFLNPGVEAGFDTIKDIVSVANAARNLAGLKRRWPVNEVIICGQNFESLKIEGMSFVLENQLNSDRYRLVEISNNSQLQKVSDLIDKAMPVSVRTSLIRKNIAPRVKADINKVSEAFERLDKLELVRTLRRSDGYLLGYDAKTIMLSSSDIEINYEASDGYSSVERDGLVVFVSTIRDKEAVVKGLLRDLARQIQQLRKERRYNPTDVLDSAYITGLTSEEIVGLSRKKDELTFLIRVKNIDLFEKDPEMKISYKVIEIDGREFKIAVE
ncbi:MAG: class I tRNA ligase family protein, partial [Thermoproteota archaeon]|nr:class I tRNA ligase family protein [Thermoproteota archaeon]